MITAKVAMATRRTQATGEMTTSFLARRSMVMIPETTTAALEMTTAALGMTTATLEMTIVAQGTTTLEMTILPNKSIPTETTTCIDHTIKHPLDIRILGYAFSKESERVKLFAII